MENNKLETKQNYLRNAILNKGYNAQDFFNFLIQKKGEEGGDLNNWNFIELENVVKEFQSIYNINNIENIENNIEISNENNNNLNENNLNENNNNENNNNFQNNFNKNSIENKTNINLLEIQCLSDDKSPLSEYNQLNIKLSE
jgi:hypothetical protein